MRAANSDPHESHLARSSLRAKSPGLTGNALSTAPGALAPQRIRETIPHGRRHGAKAERRAVWDRELTTPRDPTRQELTACSAYRHNGLLIILRI
jgi:hypothetical protein